MLGDEEVEEIEEGLLGEELRGLDEELPLNDETLVGETFLVKIFCNPFEGSFMTFVLIGFTGVTGAVSTIS